jgi:hypothetical protein
MLKASQRGIRRAAAVATRGDFQDAFTGTLIDRHRLYTQAPSTFDPDHRPERRVRP